MLKRRRDEAFVTEGKAAKVVKAGPDTISQVECWCGRFHRLSYPRLKNLVVHELQLLSAEEASARTKEELCQLLANHFTPELNKLTVVSNPFDEPQERELSERSRTAFVLPEADSCRQSLRATPEEMARDDQKMNLNQLIDPLTFEPIRDFVVIPPTKSFFNWDSLTKMTGGKHPLTLQPLPPFKDIQTDEKEKAAYLDFLRQEFGVRYNPVSTERPPEGKFMWHLPTDYPQIPWQTQEEGEDEMLEDEEDELFDEESEILQLQHQQNQLAQAQALTQMEEKKLEVKESHAENKEDKKREIIYFCAQEWKYMDQKGKDTCLAFLDSLRLSTHTWNGVEEKLYFYQTFPDFPFMLVGLVGSDPKENVIVNLPRPAEDSKGITELKQTTNEIFDAFTPENKMSEATKDMALMHFVSVLLDLLKKDRQEAAEALHLTSVDQLPQSIGDYPRNALHTTRLGNSVLISPLNSSLLIFLHGFMNLWYRLRLYHNMVWRLQLLEGESSGAFPVVFNAMVKYLDVPDFEKFIRQIQPLPVIRAIAL